MEALNEYLRMSGISFDGEAISCQLLSSPYYPSLYAYARTLEGADIKTDIGRADIPFLKSLKKPFLLHINIKGKERLTPAKWDSGKNIFTIYTPSIRKWTDITEEREPFTLEIRRMKGRKARW